MLGAYRAFWDAYLDAADPMDPAHPMLDDVATGEELEHVRRAFQGRLSAGEVIRGTVELSPHVEDITTTVAMVSDCYRDRTGVYDATTGHRKDRDDDPRYRVIVRLARVGSLWKVSRITPEGHGCIGAG